MGNWLEEREADWQAFESAFQAWKSERFTSVCLESCTHHCCNLKETKLRAPKEEIRVILGGEPEDWSAYESDVPGLYRFSAGDCPHYDRDTRRCLIWENPERPSICREFPFGLYHDHRYAERRIYISPACGFTDDMPAFQELVGLASRHQVMVVKLQPSPE